MLTRRNFLALAAAAPAMLRGGYGQADAAGPRCFLTPARLDLAKHWKDGPLLLAWTRMHAHCDRIVKAGAAAYQPPSPKDGEMLWQRNVGNGLATVAMGYLLTGNQDYKQFALEQARAAAGYAMWGGPDATKEGVDLAAGHLLLGIAVLVDWMGSEMDAKTRTLLLDTLERRGTQMAAGSAKVYWSRTLLQNHLWVNMTGLLAAGLTIQRYDPAAAHPLIVTAAQKMQPCFPVLAEDGSDQEGAGYWSYGAEYLLKYHQLATELLGLKLEAPWLRHTAEYAIAMTLPLASVGPKQSIFDTADSLRTPYYGPEYLLRRLASLNRDGAAQEMAMKLEALGAVEPPADWLNFIWYDPAVPAQGLAALPTLQHFSDLDLVVARSDRTGHESAIAMRAGPPLGKNVQAMHIDHDIGTAHVHPDVNHITLFGGGEFLLLDNGYASVKETLQHNTLVVNGKQQLGSGAQWMKWPSYPIADPQPCLRAVTSQPAFDYWVGEGATAYPASAGLTRFNRHVLFIKPKMLLVVDDLEASSTADFLLLWHPGGAPLGDSETAFHMKINRATLQLRLMLPHDSHVTTGTRTFATHERGNQTMHEIAVTVKARSARCAALFTWAGEGEIPADGVISEAKGVWTALSGNLAFALDVDDMRVKVSELGTHGSSAGQEPFEMARR